MSNSQSSYSDSEGELQGLEEVDEVQVPVLEEGEEIQGPVLEEEVEVQDEEYDVLRLIRVKIKYDK